MAYTDNGRWVSNKVSIDRVQTQDRVINQLQNNTVKSLTDLGNTLSQINIIGEVKQAYLTLSQMQSQAGPGWVLCSGQNIVGSALNRLTGVLVTPTIAGSGGVNVFIRIN